jgi:hypothetical protein
MSCAFGLSPFSDRGLASGLGGFARGDMVAVAAQIA